jgi:uncharacterized protein (DUF2249 family)
MNTPSTEPTLDANKVMDVRPIPCSIKHGLIMRTWMDLAVDDHFILLNDHDPVPLYYQFAAMFPGSFTWEYMERGPSDFRVKISKTRRVTDVRVESLPQGCNH